MGSGEFPVHSAGVSVLTAYALRLSEGATATAITTLVTAIANAIFAALVSNIVQCVKILTFLTDVVQRGGV